MKLVKTIAVVGLLVQFLCACKKDLSCETCREENKPPLANAGADQTTALPKDSVLLDGSASSDPDGSIKEWQWTKLAGPSSFILVNSSAIKTTVKDLHGGTYQFELKVTDDKGAGARDTVQVIVRDPLQSNHPPVTNAGPDQTITLPTNAVTLDGGASSDPDNNITSYLWTKLTGPPSFTISSATAVQAQISSLTEGVYRFELKVTDAGGLTANDTVQVSVRKDMANSVCNRPEVIPSYACENNRPQVNAQLIPIGKLSLPRMEMAVAAAGNKILFAGGMTDATFVDLPSSRVDIFDLSNNSWSTAELSVGRFQITATANGNKVFFAGGEEDGTTFIIPSNQVDIYDVSTNGWTTGQLSVAGYGPAAAAVGNKVLFAGGLGRATSVDIYNLSTNTWSTASLCDEGKDGGHAAVTLNGKVYIAGGLATKDWTTPVRYATNRIDVYDGATNTWSADFLSQGRVGLAGIVANNKIYWAGGASGTYSSSNSLKPTCLVETKEGNAGTTVVQSLSRPTHGTQAVRKDNQILFFCVDLQNPSDRNKFDIYDIATNSWSVGVLPMTIGSSAIISVNNIVYIAGGVINGVLSNQVWKLEF